MLCDDRKRNFYVVDSIAEYIDKWVELYAKCVPYAEYEGEFVGIFESIVSTMWENSIGANSPIVRKVLRGDVSEDGDQPFILSTLYWQLVMEQSTMEDMMCMWCGLIQGSLKMQGLDYTKKSNVSRILVIRTLQATLQELFINNLDFTSKSENT